MPQEIEYRLEGFETAATPETNLHEVEERAILDPGQGALIQDRIRSQGGSYLNRELIEDIYFCPNDVTSHEDQEARGLDREIIRLRRVRTIETDGQEHIETIFTTKLMSGGDYGDWTETNYPREGDFLDAGTEGLRNRYSLKPFFVLSKPRENWQLEDTTISFDVVPDFGNVLEAEKITTAEKVPATKAELQQTLRRLGVRPDQKPQTSITNQLIRTRSFF